MQAARASHNPARHHYQTWAFNFALWFAVGMAYTIPWGDAMYDGTARLFGTAATGLTLVSFLINGTHRNYSWYHVFVLLFTCMMGISLMWAPDYQFSVVEADKMLKLGISVFVFSYVFSTMKSVIWGYRAYALGTVTASIWTIYNYNKGIQTYWNRYGLENIETDDLSIMMAAGVCILAYLLSLASRVWVKAMYAAFLCIVVYAIVLTATRTAAIILVFPIAYLLYETRKLKLVARLSLVAVLFFSLPLAVGLMPKTSTDRILSAGKGIKTGNLNYREVIWAESLRNWKQNPILGVGVGGLLAMNSSNHVEYGHAHNAFIQILGETGVLGFLLYLLILISIFYYAVRSPGNDMRFLVMIFMTLQLASMTMHIHNGKWAWLLFTLMAMHGILQNKSRSA